MVSAPASTYRVQVNAAFTLHDAACVADYLRDLGVGALYSSPILRSTEGSTHGYDVVAHDRIDDEAGGRDGLDALAEALRGNDLGFVLDIVPNHAAIEGNAWWSDVLENGPNSPYARAFDIDWSWHDGRILLPVLGDGEAEEAHQHYLRAHWRRGIAELNYRRFFDVTSLAGLRVEDPWVFDQVHALVIELVRDLVVTGLRVDHVDGLADPQGYLDRLARETGGVWTVVEKILQPGERLPDWPVAGTTGYDALAEVTGQFVDPDGVGALTRVYRNFTGDDREWADVVAESKRYVLENVLVSEVEWLHRLLPHEPREEIVETLVALPVYRTYHPVGGMNPAFTLRFQQISSAVMAKGVEDTAFYRYTRLVSLNEVGGSPAVRATAIDPDRRGMTTLSTHDTKRSEDVRARISLLAEVPEEWAAAVGRWSALTRRSGAEIERNLEYLMYQTFVGAYPLDVERAVAYALKAAREQKQRTSWLDPDPGYEATVERWVRHTLCDAAFLADLDAFMAPLVVHGWVASLAQKLVQLTMPGVPDVYQGTELWDYSLVDPDNRRPVDYGLRRRLLAEVDALDVETIGDRAAEGLPKLLVTSRALRLRRARPEAFAGAYETLPAEGAWAERVLAFARGGEVVTVVPRRFVHADDWKDTTLALPRGRWHDVLTGDDTDGGDVLVADLLARFPVALLERR